MTVMESLTAWTIVLDIALVLVILGYAGRMYRVGLVSGALSLVGLLAGGLLALWVLPDLLERWSVGLSVLQRAVIMLVGTLLTAALGQSLGVAIGHRVRSWVRFRPARVLDSVLGAVAGVVVVSTVVWLAAGAVHGTLPPPATQTVAGSRVLQGIDRLMPASADRVVANAQQAIDAHDFPRVFSGLQVEPIRPVEPPEPGVASGKGVAAAADSVVRVVGTAPECGRSQQGSGWVAAPERVVTNAHVVAGIDDPSVQIGGTGRAWPTTTVAFDARRDVAVLAVPGLPADPLPAGPRLGHGDGVVIAGYPLGGPYDLEAGRVRDVLTARGRSIDGSTGATREVYSFSGQVEHGNSGGPVLSPDGQVVGTVFAKSESGPDTGYALTLAETRPVVEEAAGATQEVSTGSCVR